MQIISLADAKYHALVDDSDFDLVNQYRWITLNARGMIYAQTTNTRSPERLMHKLITGYNQTDHKDGDGLNNQRSNLRLATQSQNRMSAAKYAVNTTSTFKGVSWDKRRGMWRGQIGKTGSRYSKYFDSETDAALWYNDQAQTLYGEFALLNEVS